MSRRKIKVKTIEPEYPAATLMFFGPDDKLATKAVVTIIRDRDSEQHEVRKWYTEDGDVREDMEIGEEIFGYLAEQGKKTPSVPIRMK